MGAVEDLVRPLLHPTESVNVAVETAQLPQVGLDAGTVDSGEDAGDPRRSASLGNAEEKEEIHCVLAVVFHVGAPGEVEEGSLFICKRKSTEDASNEVLDIHRAIPISKDFSITMAQTRRNTIDLSTAASRSVLDQPRVGFTIIVNSGQEGDEEPLYFYTHDTQSLKALLAECKRFKDQLLQEVDTTPGTYDTFIPTFAWLLPYVARARSSPSVTVRPWDIRILNQPLYSRLSHASAGQAGDEFSDIITIRDQWVRDTIRTTQQRGTRNLRIRLGTFNVNGTIPSQDLSSWVQGESAKPPASAQAEVQSPLLPVTPKGATHDADTKSIASGVTLVDPTEETATNADSTSDTSLDDDGDPDIFVFGFQELDLSTEALLITTSTFREDAWTTAIFAALGEKAIKYEKLASKQLVGVLITIIVRKSMKSNFKEVKSTSAGAGILGLMGNKGGAAIRLEYSPPPTQGLDLKSPLRTIFTFVNAHLAAFDEMYERRNADYQDLCKRLTFPTGVIAQPTTVATGLDRYTIFDTDVLFWIGDLNYRVDLLDKDIRETLQSGYPDKYEALLKYDQLRRAQRTGKAFVGFSEQTTSHLPTYRFGPGLPTDALGYDLKRKPAWTDRVLYMHDPAVKLSQVSYTGHRRITQSDHRPVGADFIVGVNLYENDQVDAAARKLYRQLEPLEHASLKPSLKVNTTSVDFGVFSYRRPVTKTLELRNTGKTPCAYRFLPVEANTPAHPEWMKIEPMVGLLLPDEIVTITLTTIVDAKVASRLNFGPRDLDCTLVLHTIFGKDLFVSAVGRYDYTCYGIDLSKLTRIKGPIRTLDSMNSLLPEDQARNAPKEVLRLVNWLMGPDIDLHILFVKPAREEIVNIIGECLDTGEEFTFPKTYTPTDIATAFGATLMELLDALPESLVPRFLHSRCTQMADRDEAFELLDAFPQSHVNVWISITAFLHFICQSSTDQENKINTMLSIWTPILLRDDLNFPPVSPAGKRRFLRYFIA